MHRVRYHSSAQSLFRYLEREAAGRYGPGLIPPRRRKYGTRLLCRLIGHSWRHEWGPSSYAPISCTRCGVRDTSGTRLHGGLNRLFAYIRAKAHGTTTPATATTVAYSFSNVRGSVPAELVTLHSTTPVVVASRSPLRLVNSSTAPGSSTDATATHGANGEPLERADSDRPWPSWSS